MLFAESLTRLKHLWQRRRDLWVLRRHPPASPAQIKPRNIYILPTSACLGWILLLFILILLAINFENNLVYGLCFLLTAVLVVSMVHTHANLRGLQLESLRAINSFADAPTRFDLRITAGSRSQTNIQLRYRGGDPRSISLETDESIDIELSGAAGRRGWFYPRYLRVESRFPLGLFNAWSYVDLGQRSLVYPQPIEGGVLEPVSGQGEAVQERSGGQDEFAGFIDYQPGMPIRQVAWKQYARGQGLYAKRFNDQVAEGTWLSWELWPELGLEARLSRLSYWAIKLDQCQIPYGLVLPERHIQAGEGSAHLTRVLTALALFGVGPADE